MRKINQFSIFRKASLASAILLSCFLLNPWDSIAQSSQDFWSAFTECTMITELQSHYPVVGQGQTQVHALMDHGVEIPDMNNVTLDPNISFQVYPKQAILENNLSEFFLIHEYTVNGTKAEFDLVYYYDFDGSYETYQSTKVKLEKSNNEWNVVNAASN